MTREPVPYTPLEWPRRLLVLALRRRQRLVPDLARSARSTRDAPIFSALVYGAELFGFVTALLHIFMCWRLTDRSAPPPPARPHGRRVHSDLQRIGRAGPQDAARGARHGLSAQDLAARRRPPPRDGGARRAARLRVPRARRQQARQGRQPEPCAAAQQRRVHRDLRRRPRAAARLPGQDARLLRRTGRSRSCRRRRTSTTSTRTSTARRGSRPHGVDRAVAVLPRDPARQGLLERRVLLRQLRGDPPHARSTRSAASRPAPSPRTCTPRCACTRKGYKSVYHAEPLAFGMAPESMAPFIGQRVRWGQGAMHVWRKEGILFAPRADAWRSGSTTSPRCRPTSTAGRRRSSTSRR